MAYKLSFTLPGLPKIMSNGSHGNWRTAAGIKRKWKDLSIIHCRRHLPPQPLKKAEAVFTRFSSVEPDNDNLAISFKSIRDGLVEAGVIEDDRPSVLTATYQWVKASPKAGQVSVELVETIP